MKRVILGMFVAIMGMATGYAQQIAVVSSDGATKMYQTLADAIGGATSGSVIYLPGGGFQISDDVKITKKVSIIGIGHKAVSENADGNTVISGNLYFNDGSDGSAVMGCYISGTVYIGYDNTAVDNILVKLCNLRSIYVYSSKCTGTIVNQNYIRSISNFKGASGEFTNNIAYNIYQLSGGTISNNILTSTSGYSDSYGISSCTNSTISNNVYFGYISGCSNSLISNNMSLSQSDGDDPIKLDATSWNEVFENYNNGTISPASDFHFKGKYTQYSDCGIYGGTGFDKEALPPVPYIVSKNIATQTNAAGMLEIKVRVKAGE